MGMIYDVAMWVNTLVEQMGMWVAAPAFLGAAVVGLKMTQPRFR